MHVLSKLFLGLHSYKMCYSIQVQINKQDDMSTEEAQMETTYKTMVCHMLVMCIAYYQTNMWRKLHGGQSCWLIFIQDYLTCTICTIVCVCQFGHEFLTNVPNQIRCT